MSIRGTTQLIETRIDEMFRAYDHPNSPGGAVGIIRNGEWVLKKGYGMANLEHEVPITPQTVFCLASLAKQFTGFCILLLEEQGRLALDEDIRVYLPEMPDYGAPITIAHLLYQTSGLRDYYVNALLLMGVKLHDYLTEEEAMELITAQRSLIFPPGAQFHYSNTNYLLLSQIVRRVTGETLGAFARQHVFEPLGMYNTFFLEDHSKVIKRRATAYGEYPLRNDSPLRYLPGADEDLHYTLTNPSELTGDDGVWSTLEDLYLWDQNLSRNRLGQGRQELIDRYLTPGRLADGTPTHYACGLCVGTNDGRPVIEHNGWYTGYLAVIERYPEQGTTILILSNTNRLIPWSFTGEIRQMLFEEKIQEQEAGADDARTSASAAPAKCPAPPEKLSDVRGWFFCQENAYIWHIWEMDGELSASVNGEWEMGLEWSGEERFRTSTGYDVVPASDEQGRRTHLRVLRGDREWEFRAFVPGRADEAQLEAAAGTYRCEELQTAFDVQGEQGMLRLRNHNRHRTGLDLRFTHATGDAWYAHDPSVDGVVLEFQRGEDGSIERFVFRSRSGDGREHLTFVRTQFPRK